MCPSTEYRIVFRTGRLAVRRLSRIKCIAAEWFTNRLPCTLESVGLSLSDLVTADGQLLHGSGAGVAKVFNALYDVVPVTWLPSTELDMFHVQERLIAELVRLRLRLKGRPTRRRRPSLPRWGGGPL